MPISEGMTVYLHGDDILHTVNLNVLLETGIVQRVGLDGIYLYEWMSLGQIYRYRPGICTDIDHGITLSENGHLRQIIVMFHPPNRNMQTGSVGGG